MLNGSSISRRVCGEVPAYGRGSPAEKSRSQRTFLGTTYEIGQPPLESGFVSRVLKRWELQAVAKFLLPESRLSVCFRTIRTDQQDVKVWKHGEHTAHYSGLMVCGSVWICPVCAAKISERRRKELQQAVDAWKALGGIVKMLTLTLPHYAHQSLKHVLTSFGNSRKLMLNRKEWKKLKKELGLVGTIRALEVTYGENGWHVHSHEILFLSAECSMTQIEIERRILAMWQKACETVCKAVPNEHGVSLDDEHNTGKYVGKWGMDCELSKAHIKEGRDGNYTPFDLLRRYKEGRYEAGELFEEYAHCFKGKRQLVWSEGLRELLGVKQEKSDLEIAQEIDVQSILLGAISRGDWRFVVAANKRAELLIVAASEGWPEVIVFLEKLKGKPFLAKWGRASDSKSDNKKPCSVISA